MGPQKKTCTPMRPALLTFIPKADSKASTHPLASLQLKYVKIVIVDDQRLQETGCLVENTFVNFLLVVARPILYNLQNQTEFGIRENSRKGEIGQTREPPFPMKIRERMIFPRKQVLKQRHVCGFNPEDMYILTLRY